MILILLTDGSGTLALSTISASAAAPANGARFKGPATRDLFKVPHTRARKTLKTFAEKMQKTDNDEV